VNHPSSSVVRRGILGFVDAVSGRKVDATAAAGSSFQGSGASSARAVRRFAVSLLTVIAATAVVTSSAQATKFVDSFIGNPTSLTGAGGSFNEAAGVAVNDATGDVYVIDRPARRVQQFNASNEFVRAWGQDVVGLNEQQRVVVSATGGTYTLTFDGSTTGAIAFNASASAVDNALDVLPSISGDANVAVSGSQASGYTVTFQGTLAGTDVPEMTADSAGLTGGASTATVSTLVTGAGGAGTGFEICSDPAICKIGVAGTTGGGLNSPQGIAVNQSTGDVYVTDGSNLRVQQFSSTGSFIRAWGQDVIVAAGPPANDNGTGFEVCDTTAGNTAADCKAGTSGTFGGAFASTFSGYPAVVPAGASNAGNVLVADPGNRRMQEFTASGVFVRAFGYDVVSPGGTGEQIGAPLNEQQRVRLEHPLAAIGGSITGGTFRLTFNGEQTAAIAFNATAADVDAALEALSTVGAGNVAVSGAAGGGSGATWIAEFTGTLAGIDVAPMTIDGSALTANFGTPTASVSTLVAGGPGPAFEICTIATECQAAAAGGPEVGRFQTNQPTRVAADTTGAIYTVESSGSFRVQKFTPQAGPPALAATVFADAILTAASASSAPTDVAVDPASGHVFVTKAFSAGASTCSSGPSADGERRIVELAPAGALLDTHVACAGITSGNGLALRPSTGTLLFSATTIDHRRVWVADDDGAPAPIVVFNPASEVSSSGADLSATINSNTPLMGTDYRFEVSRNGVTWTPAGNGQVAAGATPLPVSTTVTGLRPNTQYRVRIVSGHGFGNPPVTSAELTFLTDAVAPSLMGVRSTDVTDTAARLVGRVNPNSTSTTYRFEYGAGTFNRVVPVPSAAIGSGPDFVLVSEPLSGLQPGTTYQFRLVATSASEGTTTSATKTFTTLAAAPGPQGRAYELVSPAYKESGIGVGFIYAGPGALGAAGSAAHVGDRFAVNTAWGAPLIDGDFSYATDTAFAGRVSDTVGWTSRSAMPVAYGDTSTRFLFLQSSTPDFGVNTWTSNKTGFAPFAEMAAWPGINSRSSTLATSWSGADELLGPTDPEQGGFSSTSSEDAMEAVPAADGRTFVASGAVYGLGGPTDPTHPSWSPSALREQAAMLPRNVYRIDVGDGLTNAFPDNPDDPGDRELISVCTGSGADRTELPADVGGDFGAVTCPDALPGRDARLISNRGAVAAGVINSGGAYVPARDVISADGSRVFFMSPDPRRPGGGTSAAGLLGCSGTGDAFTCPPQVYVSQRNQDGTEHVRWLSRPEPGLLGEQAALLAGGAIFEGASADGGRVFFRTPAPLTADDPNGLGAQTPGGVKAGSPSLSSWDLYGVKLSESGDPAGPGSELTRITAGPEGDADCNNPQGTPSAVNPIGSGPAGSLRFHSGDGSRVYFACSAPLGDVGDAWNAAPAGGITAPGGAAGSTDQTNIYLYDATKDDAEERWRFVARIPRSTSPGQTFFDACASTGTSQSGEMLGSLINSAITDPDNIGNCWRGRDDGRFVTFWARAPLTVDDADDGSVDLYGYDAQAHELVRLSAPQDGLPDDPYPCGTVAPVATVPCHADTLGNQPPNSWRSGNANRLLGVASDPVVAGDQVAFFQSRSRLVVEDTDAAYDVYQWRNGELSLVTPGDSAEDDGAIYRGNDVTGRNVYFATRDALTWQDVDAVADVYVARLGSSGIPQPAVPTGCGALANECQGPGIGVPANTQIDSDNTAGGGNVVSDKRKTLRVSGLSAKARKKAARTGSFVVSVRTSKAGKVSAVAKGRIGKRTRRVASKSVRVRKAGKARLKLRLNRAARQRLSRGKALKLTIQVRSPGARSRSMTVRLPGVKS
jgi:hypothetical protein